MKRTFLIILGFFFILFFAPWMGEDGGEKIIRKVAEEEEIKNQLNYLTSKNSHNPPIAEDCDGLSSRWAPFGRKVEFCEYRNWYVAFWGQRIK